MTMKSKQLRKTAKQMVPRMPYRAWLRAAAKGEGPTASAARRVMLIKGMR
jgi:hypothetical protein